MRREDFSRAAALAVGVHALLFIALYFGFQWKTTSEEVYAELWASAPASGESEKGGPALEEPKQEPASAPAKEDPPAPPPPKPEVRPAEKPAAKPVPAPQQQAQAKQADIIAAERKKAEEARRQKEEAQKREAAEKKAAEEAKRRAAEAAREQAEKVRTQEAARLAMAKVRAQEIARVAGGASSKTAAGTPSGDRDALFQNLSGSARASFIARVTACIRPHIIFDVPAGVRRGQHQAAYRVRLLPSGDQAGTPRKTKSSGLPGYDAAVERAIAKCPRFPSMPGVAMPSEVSLTFDPVDNR